MKKIIFTFVSSFLLSFALSFPLLASEDDSFDTGVEIDLPSFDCGDDTGNDNNNVDSGFVDHGIVDHRDTCTWDYSRVTEDGDIEDCSFGFTPDGDGTIEVCTRRGRGDSSNGGSGSSGGSSNPSDGSSNPSDGSSNPSGGSSNPSGGSSNHSGGSSNSSGGRSSYSGSSSGPDHFGSNSSSWSTGTRRSRGPVGTGPGGAFTEEELLRYGILAPEIVLKEKACDLLESYPSKVKAATDSGVGKGIILASKGLHALGVESLRSGETKEGVFFLSRAIQLLDVAMDFTPGVGWAKDCIQAISGVNPITGEKLSTFERSAALIGAVTVGFGSKFLKGFKAVTKFLRGNSAVVRLTKKTIESSGVVRSKLFNVGKNIPGTTIPHVFSIETQGAKFFVNSCATKHMAEYIIRLPKSGGFLLRNDMMLASFEVGLRESVKSGTWKVSLQSGRPIVSGGWELIFAKRSTDQFVVVKHALMKW